MSNTGPRTEAGKMVVSQNLNPTAWTQNPAAIQAIDVARRLRSTKHGLYASVPIICKAESCPYRESCPLMQMQMAPFGEKCPIEIAAIEDLFDRYCTDLKIDREDPKNTVDLIMVKELVDIDVSLLRCDNKMAIDADFIIENVVGMTEDGDALVKKELHPVVEYKEKLRNSKNKTLQLLNSTRRDKQGTKVTVELDPASRASQMVKVNDDMDAHMENEDEAERRYYEKMRGNNEPIDITPIEVEPIE
ncbi:hypothetical protein PUW25_25425 (plasmid) [Paenibacillus urinalis]|uniref:Uncharacterized protein n=1 Tax=Paenibacillus urinalis TaxID=521520 RepID=A0ABY7XH41_9BACL|nr:hypothetical protein [Paenibacillus urinalis]WDI05152.1 hypothetical protein PUW25_25425 [Paenibacillus urinalis]